MLPNSFIKKFSWVLLFSMLFSLFSVFPEEPAYAAGEFSCFNSDGKAYAYWICSAGIGKCKDGNHRLVNKSCLKNSKKWGSGAKCHVFAHIRTIRWDNGINKRTKFKSKWSDDEIIAKLTASGFYGNTSSSHVAGNGASERAVDKFTARTLEMDLIRSWDLVATKRKIR